MNEPRVINLPYHANSAELFAPLADAPWAVFLDSGKPVSEQGRYDIISAWPHKVITTRGHRTEIRTASTVTISYDDPFAILRSHLQLNHQAINDLPFCGGAIGYFGYDLGRRIERLFETAESDIDLPDMVIGLYDWALIVDHQSQQSSLVMLGEHPLPEHRWQLLLDQFQKSELPNARQPFSVTSNITSNMQESDYATAFNKIKEYIRAGDCYQVNLAQRFSTLVKGHPWTAYSELRRINPAPFAAYMNNPDGQILSASPERFLQVNDTIVETKPIKGTRARLNDEAQDKVQIEILKHSIKDRAENVMIVDLLRNDISKNCAAGSVKVPHLFEIESFATVHHLVSTVTGRLSPGRDILHLLRGCFPGGSITGAPKLRAMQIIEELEPQRRSIYCGSIGYISAHGRMDTNIAIRTLIHTKKQIHFYAGGGIVADSELQSEYQETFDKVASMFKLLKSFEAN